jgi:hypothetical protein
VLLLLFGSAKPKPSLFLTRFDDNGGASPNYEPNSFGGPTQDPAYVERPKMVSGTVARHNHRDEDDYYTQPGTPATSFVFHTHRVTSNLASTISIGDHGRGRDGLPHSESSCSKSFVSRILTSKSFRLRNLRGNSC